MVDVIGCAAMLAKAALWRLGGNTAEVCTDYDTVSRTYDEHYARVLAVATAGFMAAVPVPTAPGARIVELAAGTGEVTRRLAAAAPPAAHLSAVDRSPGMLAVNRAKNAASGVEFVEADALAHLRSLPDASVDLLVCAWAVCYLPRRALRRQIARVVRPGGHLCVVENRRGSLREVEHVFTRTLLRHPQALGKAVAVRLPAHARALARELVPAGWRVLHATDAELGHRFDDTASLRAYLLSSGVAAGYLDALGQGHRAAFVDAVEHELARLGPAAVPVVHRYSTLVARARGARPTAARHVLDHSCSTG